MVKNNKNKEKEKEVNGTNCQTENPSKTRFGIREHVHFVLCIQVRSEI